MDDATATTGSADQTSEPRGQVEGEAAVTPPTSQTGEVSYDTHRRLLGEKKRLQEERDRLKDELASKLATEKQAEEERLAKNEEWKKLVEIREKELAEANSKLELTARQQTDARKLDAFLKALDGNVARKYWGLIDIDQIAVDPESGAVDDMSVKALVDGFRKEHGILIEGLGAPNKLPTDAPAGNATNVTYEQWCKMSAKDKKANYQAMLANDRQRGV